MPTKINIESYINEKAEHINTLKITGEYEINRLADNKYEINSGDRCFEITVGDGAKTSVIALQGPEHNLDPNITTEFSENTWPKAIIKLKANYNGYFHLEQMDQDNYCLVTPWETYNFKTFSGPAKQYLIVREK